MIFSPVANFGNQFLISETIFQGHQNGKTRYFQKKKFPRDPYLKKPILGYQRKVVEKKWGGGDPVC